MEVFPLHAEWFLIQYTHDLRRHEPRNVGIAVNSPAGWHLRFVGERPDGGFDGHKLKSFKLERDYFESWVKYYRRSAESDTWEDALTLQQRRPHNFTISSGGVQLETETNWQDFTARLFGELVADPAPKPGDDFDSRVRKLFRAANITPQENVELEGLWTPGGPVHRIRFDFGVQHGQGGGIIEKVPLRDTPVFSFKGRRDAVQLRDPRTKFIAITEWTGRESEDKMDALLHPLEEIAQTINLEDSTAADQLVEALAL